MRSHFLCIAFVLSGVGYLVADSPRERAAGSYFSQRGHAKIGWDQDVQGRINFLNLSDEDASDRNLQRAAQLRNLQGLSLLAAERGAVTDVGAHAISRLENLEYLSLRGTTISDEPSFLFRKPIGATTS